ncbi:hypothetical protein HZC53_02670 [Candidatus Uhrbacteria bacterium]|nr:hypothetical protein [Candidatus Uhrbacteria bacterium]
MENHQNVSGHELQSYDGLHWGPAMHEPACPLELHELAKEEWLPTAVAALLCSPFWFILWLLHGSMETSTFAGVAAFFIFLITAYPIGMCIRCLFLTAAWLTILPFRWSWRGCRALLMLLRPA